MKNQNGRNRLGTATQTNMNKIIVQEAFKKRPRKDDSGVHKAGADSALGSFLSHVTAQILAEGPIVTLVGAVHHDPYLSGMNTCYSMDAAAR